MEDLLPLVTFAKATVDKSYAQHLQDLFGLWAAGSRLDGYFVEFGALNGITASNSYLMERLGWKGIVAEPHPHYAEILSKNRRCHVSTDCVWSVSGEVIKFKAVRGRPALSSVASIVQDDEQQRRGLRDNYTEYDLQTISLLDLLHGFGAPRHIDFLSIDTEGSELLILQAFDFSRYRFGAITVEHNYSSIREPLHNHLVLHGYRRIWPEISAHDDWYVGNEFRQPSALESAQLISALANLPDNPESPSVRRKIVAGLVG